MGVCKQYIAGLSAAFGAFCLGASIGWSGPMELPVKMGAAYKFSMSTNDFGWASSVLVLGAALMCIPVGLLIGAFGRKFIMLLLVLPYLLGWVCIIIPPKGWVLYIGRFVIGACGGAFCVTAPMYTTEIAQISVRGVMGCFFQLLIVHGVLYGFIVGGHLKPLLVNILCAILPLIFFIIFIWMPESPVYLVQKGKTEKAEKAMKWLRGKDADISGEMSAMAADAKKEKVAFKEAMGRKPTIVGLLVAVTLMMLQQITGINAILFYSTSIFQQAGTGISPSNCTIIIGVVQVLAVVAAMLLVEKAGRKMLLLISAVSMVITTLIMGFYFQYLMAKNVGWLPILCICLFIIGFSLGFGPVPWVIMAEIFSEDVKPFCGAIVGTSSWLFAFIVTKLFPIFLGLIGPAASFWIFTGFSALAVVFVIFFVPETKGKTLDEIQVLIGG